MARIYTQRDYDREAKSINTRLEKLDRAIMKGEVGERYNVVGEGAGKRIVEKNLFQTSFLGRFYSWWKDIKQATEGEILNQALAEINYSMSQILKVEPKVPTETKKDITHENIGSEQLKNASSETAKAEQEKNNRGQDAAKTEKIVEPKYGTRLLNVEIFSRTLHNAQQRFIETSLANTDESQEGVKNKQDATKLLREINQLNVHLYNSKAAYDHAAFDISTCLDDARSFLDSLDEKRWKSSGDTGKRFNLSELKQEGKRIVEKGKDRNLLTTDSEAIDIVSEEYKHYKSLSEAEIIRVAKSAKFCLDNLENDMSPKVERKKYFFQSYYEWRAESKKEELKRVIENCEELYKRTVSTNTNLFQMAIRTGQSIDLLSNTYVPEKSAGELTSEDFGVVGADKDAYKTLKNAAYEMLSKHKLPEKANSPLSKKVRRLADLHEIEQRAEMTNCLTEAGAKVLTQKDKSLLAKCNEMLAHVRSNQKQYQILKKDNAQSLVIMAFSKKDEEDLASALIEEGKKELTQSNLSFREKFEHAYSYMETKLLAFASGSSAMLRAYDKSGNFDKSNMLINALSGIQNLVLGNSTEAKNHADEGITSEEFASIKAGMLARLLDISKEEVVAHIDQELLINNTYVGITAHLAQPLKEASESKEHIRKWTAREFMPFLIGKEGYWSELKQQMAERGLDIEKVKGFDGFEKKVADFRQILKANHINDGKIDFNNEAFKQFVKEDISAQAILLNFLIDPAVSVLLPKETRMEIGALDGVQDAINLLKVISAEKLTEAEKRIALHRYIMQEEGVEGLPTRANISSELLPQALKDFNEFAHPLAELRKLLKENNINKGKISLNSTFEDFITNNEDAKKAFHKLLNTQAAEKLDLREVSEQLPANAEAGHILELISKAADGELDKEDKQFIYEFYVMNEVTSGVNIWETTDRLLTNNLKEKMNQTDDPAQVEMAEKQFMQLQELRKGVQDAIQLCTQLRDSFSPLYISNAYKNEELRKRVDEEIVMRSNGYDTMIEQLTKQLDTVDAEDKKAFQRQINDLQKEKKAMPTQLKSAVAAALGSDSYKSIYKAALNKQTSEQGRKELQARVKANANAAMETVKKILEDPGVAAAYEKYLPEEVMDKIKQLGRPSKSAQEKGKNLTILQAQQHNLQVIAQIVEVEQRGILTEASDLFDEIVGGVWDQAKKILPGQ